MTANQIAYQKMRRESRDRRLVLGETQRANRSQEAINWWDVQHQFQTRSEANALTSLRDQEQARANRAREREALRSNMAKEQQQAFDTMAKVSMSAADRQSREQVAAEDRKLRAQEGQYQRDSDYRIAQERNQSNERVAAVRNPTSAILSRVNAAADALIQSRPKADGSGSFTIKQVGDTLAGLFLKNMLTR